LNYISSPTMGLPGGADAYEYAAEGASETAARYALQICIRMARMALNFRRNPPFDVLSEF
jgi:hypothetical protein